MNTYFWNSKNYISNKTTNDNTYNSKKDTATVECYAGCYFGAGWFTTLP